MWKKVQYTKHEINEAGKKIVDPTLTASDRRKYLDVIDNWRAAHAYPMHTFAVNLKKQVEDIDGAIVAQRLKRLDTICGKLERFPDMELFRMQDLAGCRVIVPTIKNVYSVKGRLENSRIRHEPKTPKDYIATPNPKTGYRGVHLIYKYKSDKNSDYNGMLVEIQIRTRLQHLWATAVEMVGYFTENGLKFNQGSEDWILYFKYISELFAIEEETSLITNDYISIINLIENIMTLQEKLSAVKTMNLIAMCAEQLKHTSHMKGNGYYLLIHDRDAVTLKIQEFEGVIKGLDAATKAYNEIERAKENRRIDAVLVSAQSYETLVSAYPNYFANINDFLNTEVRLIEKAINRCKIAIAALK